MARRFKIFSRARRNNQLILWGRKSGFKVEPDSVSIWLVSDLIPTQFEFWQNFVAKFLSVKNWPEKRNFNFFVIFHSEIWYFSKQIFKICVFNWHLSIRRKYRNDYGILSWNISISDIIWKWVWFRNRTKFQNFSKI